VSLATYADFAKANLALSREERMSQLVRAEILDERGQAQDVLIRNVSHIGAGITARQFVPAVGERITLRIPGNGEVSALVRWVHGATFGVELGRQIDKQALSAAILLKAQGQSRLTNWSVQRGHRVVTPSVDPSTLRAI
jgi:hypothetical protein